MRSSFWIKDLLWKIIKKKSYLGYPFPNPFRLHGRLRWGSSWKGHLFRKKKTRLFSVFGKILGALFLRRGVFFVCLFGRGQLSNLFDPDICMNSYLPGDSMQSDLFWDGEWKRDPNSRGEVKWPPTIGDEVWARLESPGELFFEERCVFLLLVFWGAIGQ